MAPPPVMRRTTSGAFSTAGTSAYLWKYPSDNAPGLQVYSRSVGGASGVSSSA
jgi:hypothetical protein